MTEDTQTHTRTVLRLRGFDDQRAFIMQVMRFLSPPDFEHLTVPRATHYETDVLLFLLSLSDPLASLFD